jgi:hypothetical protein
LWRQFFFFSFSRSIHKPLHFRHPFSSANQRLDCCLINQSEISAHTTSNTHKYLLRKDLADLPASIPPHPNKYYSYIDSPETAGWLSMLEGKDIDETKKFDRSLTNTREKFGSGSTASPFDSSTSTSPNGELVKPQVMKSNEADPTEPASNSRRRQPRIYLNKFRVPIYVQLCLVISILCGLCVMVVAVTTVSFFYISLRAFSYCF